MPIVARAPGKAVVLGEYAVLDGAPALVLAVDRHAVATLEPSPDAAYHLRTYAPGPEDRRFERGAAAGVALIDVVAGGRASPAWAGSLDSRAFFLGGNKLGLGSSAAALCAFAGAYARFCGEPPPTVASLIALHRAFQGGHGSGLDIAASSTGGAIVYRREAADRPQISTVRLPNSVGFAGIFAGRSASTPALVAHYRAWRETRPAEAAAALGRLQSLTERGVEAATKDDAVGLVEAIADYGRALQNLGEAIGAEIVTAEHRRIGDHAKRHGVAYKVSGAGGGDLGIACALDADALEAFKQSVARGGFQVIDLAVAPRGLVVGERVEEQAQ
jgi:phosphomevalonate kinase